MQSDIIIHEENNARLNNKYNYKYNAIYGRCVKTYFEVLLFSKFIFLVCMENIVILIIYNIMEY